MLPILLVGFLMRLIGLNQSLWLDEATTARVVQIYNLQQIVSQFSPHDFHPPLYYLFMKLWTNIFGYSEIALRMPSVLFALLTAWVIYLIGKKLADKKIGLWSAAFFLFNPLIVYYSQEARMYMMVTSLLTIALYYFLESSLPITTTQSSKVFVSPLVLFNLFILLAFLTFYASIFFIAALYLFLLFKKRFRIVLLLLPGFLLSLIIVSLLLYHQYLNSKTVLVLIPNWKNVLGKANIKNLLLIPLKFSIGRISWEPKRIYYLISGLWTGLVFYFALNGKAKKDKSLLFIFIVPIILGFIFSFFTPLLDYFRFLYLLPVMVLLVGFNAKSLLNRVLILIGFVVFSLSYLFNPNFYREDWKSLAKSLPSEQEVYMIPSSADALRYYNKNITINDIRNLNQLPHSLVVIPYTTDIYGFDYKKTLLGSGFAQNTTKNFRGLSYELWVRKAFYSKVGPGFLQQPTDFASAQ